MYVTNYDSDTVSIIDGSTNTIVDTITVGEEPFGIEYNSKNNNIYAIIRGPTHVSVIDSSTNEVIKTISVGQSPWSIASNPSNNYLYVTNAGLNSVSIIADNTSLPGQIKTINDLIQNIIQNPLDVTNSIDSANEIKDILTDNNHDNDQIVCDLISSENEYTSNIGEILNC